MSTRTTLTALFASSLLATACGGGVASVPPGGEIPAAPAPAPPRHHQSSTPRPNASAAPTPKPFTDDDMKAMDAKLDASRHPADFVKFIGVTAGMTVADVGAATGYTTEILARAVGPTGKVYGQNDPELLKKFLEPKWSMRLARADMKNVIRADRTFDDPLPPEAKNLDVVVDYIFYHDIVWLGADRDKMNKAIFTALKKGGSYVIVDASAKDGDGVADAKTLHRIEESFVKTEVMRAGFTFGGSSDLLRNKDDKRDWNSAPKAAGDKMGTEDRFVLKFTKP